MNKHNISYSQLSVEQSLEKQHIKSKEFGLNEDEVKKRLSIHGENYITTKTKWGFLNTLLEPFKSWFILILAISSVISFYIGKKAEAAVILLILIINAAIYYIQNYSSKRILKSLENNNKQYCTVIRSGRHKKVEAINLIPGDIVILKEGTKVPADGRIINSNNLYINESSLTGESEAQLKSSDTLAKNLPIYEQTNMAFKGTIVSRGDGEILVTATGMHTQFGKIARLSKPKQQKSPLQIKIDKLTSKIILLVLLIAFLTFMLKLYRNAEPIEAFRFILSLTVSAIPEGLPIAVVIVMVVGIKFMATQKALVKGLSAVETLGQVSMIATDKTGTITKNKIHIAQTWKPSEKTDLESVIYKSSYAINGRGDEIDLIIYKEYKNSKSKKDLPSRYLPFDQEMRMSGAVWKNNAAHTTYIKGSVESILEACRLSEKAKKIIREKSSLLSSEGMRVIAVAAKLGDIDKISKRRIKGFSFAGLVALGDELRPEVKEAVELAHNAGIDVILLTGDHKQTAEYFGEISGIATDKSKALNGDDIFNKDHTQIRKLIKNHKVFGRVLPEHKYRIIDALRRTNITAMTGDGINDVPALRRASVGVSVGTASDAAKEASDVIILDDNFATIVSAVKYGRAIVMNVKKMLTYVLATNLGEIFTITGALIIGLPLPLTALQILWINVVTDSFTMIPIGMEKPETNLMKQPPQSSSAPILEKSRIRRMVFMSLIMAGVTLAIYYVLLPTGESGAKAVAFASLVVAQWANAINTRSDNDISFRLLKRPNWWLAGGIIVALALQLSIMFTPLSEYLNTQALSANQILIVILVFIAIIFSGDLLKLLLPIKSTSR